MGNKLTLETIARKFSGKVIGITSAVVISLYSISPSTVMADGQRENNSARPYYSKVIDGVPAYSDRPIKVDHYPTARLAEEKDVILRGPDNLVVFKHNGKICGSNAGFTMDNECYGIAKKIGGF